MSDRTTPLAEGFEESEARMATEATAKQTDPTIPTTKPMLRYFHVLPDGIDIPQKPFVLTPEQEQPEDQRKGKQRPGDTEEPDVDLFVGDAKQLGQPDQAVDGPVKDCVYPGDAAVCHVKALRSSTIKGTI